MGRVYAEIDDRLRQFILRQHVFFVATAPLSPEGRVNLSPKGIDGTLAVVDSRTVAYLDLTGSGVETISHLRENGRVTLMFCAFEGPPRILRIHGRGEAVLAGDARFDHLAERFGEFPGARSVVLVRADRISDSCGYGVPQMAFVSERDKLTKWAERKGPGGLEEYIRDNNATSIDGIEGIPL